MPPINILIVDDHKLFREAWRDILNDDIRFHVVSCGNAEEAIESVRQMEPNIILMDINMSSLSGLEATKEIRSGSPNCKIIGLSMHSHPSFAVNMLKSGAKGYVTKNSSKEELIKAILVVNNGFKYLCEEIKNNMCGQELETKADNPQINSLTTRELEVIDHIKEGLTSKEIASNLHLSAKTVQAHRYNILKKLKVKNSTSLIHFLSRKKKM